MLISSLMLLYVSIYGYQDVISVKNFITNMSSIYHVFFLIVAFIATAGYFTLKYLLRIFSISGSSRYEVAISFKIKPLLKSLDENEVDYSFRELNAYLLHLRNRGYKYALTFMNKPKKPIEIILTVFSDNKMEKSMSDLDDLLKEEFKIMCKKWSITLLNKPSEVANLIRYIPNIASISINTKHVLRDFSFLHILKLPLDASLNLNTLQDSSLHSIEEVAEEEGINIGKIEEEDIKLLLSTNDVNRHIIILGSTGSGKTTTSSIIAYGLYRLKIPVIIIDWHDEYCEKLAKLGIERVRIYNIKNPYSINPFALVKHSYEESTTIIVDILESVLGLTYPQAYYLYEILSKDSKNYDLNLSFNFLLEKLRDYVDTSEGYSGREARYALMRKIKPLTLGQAKKLFLNSNTEELITDGITIIELGGISNNTLRRLYVMFLLKKIYDEVSRRGLTNDLRLAVIIDEFHNLADVSNVLLEKLFSEIRKYGVGLIIVSQSLHDIPNYVVRNINTKIIHSIRTYRDLKELVNTLPRGPELSDLILNLKVGEALVHRSNVPYLVKAIIGLH